MKSPQPKSQVLLTRPAGENEALAARLKTQGYEVHIRPMIHLSGLSDPQSLKQTAMHLDQYHKILFVSKSSVRFGLAIAEQYWPQWPTRPEWLAVGPGTARELDEFGIRASYPESSGSEELLSLPQLCRLSGERLLIVRGRGGRELLFAELVRRGAEVEYWEVYERSELIYDDLAEDMAEVAQPHGRLLVVLTSMEIMENFARQAGPLAKHCLVLVPSQRIADRARLYAFPKVLNVGGASEQALYDAIVNATYQDDT